MSKRAFLVVLNISLMIFFQSCSTVSLTKADEQGVIDAYFQPIKVFCSDKSSYIYQVRLKNLAKLYEQSSSFEFSVFIKKKVVLEEQKSMFTPFVRSLQREGSGKIQILHEEALSPFLICVTFCIPLKDVEEAIEKESNFILNVNRGEMYWIISHTQLKDLYKTLIKHGYLIDGF